MKRLIRQGAAIVVAVLLLFSVAVAQGEFDVLTEGQQIASFEVANLWVNEDGVAIGAQFRHIPSGSVLDVLRIQSVPQGFFWINSAPPSDKGEPHAMEHMVLGKGTKALYVSALEDMTLSNSTAGTGQITTGYHFNTIAGKEVFFQILEAKLDGLLNPTFTDEDLRREICNIGYSVNPSDGSIALEEKGSVYTEMVSGFEGTSENLYMKLGEMLYGENHPLSNSSGGYPPAMREATAEDMRSFHENCYRLNNMGTIISIPDEIGLEEFLSRTSEIFARVEPDAEPGEDPASLQQRFPKPDMAPVGSIAITDFPHQNESEPGLLMLAWPPLREFTLDDALLLDLFVGNLASGDASNLYKRFIDSQTRLLDLGSSGVFGWVSSDQGMPIYIGLDDTRREAATEKMIDSVRSIVLAEIEAIANYADGSDELREFNARAASDVMSMRRQLRENLNSPPRFGFRNAGWWWDGHLHSLYRVDGFRKQLTLTDNLALAERLLSSGKNFWKEYIDKWQLLTTIPYGVAAKANPEMIPQMEAERQQRIEAFIEKLKDDYGVEDRKEAIDRFVAEYDAKTAEIDSASATVEMPRFIDDPPMTLDGLLQYRVEKLPGGGENVVSTFNNITSAEVGLAFDMTVVPEAELVYVSALPTMLTEVGFIIDGQPVSYDKASELMRKEILSLDASFDVNYATERVELAVRASGSVLEESEKGLKWIETVLYNPDWRPENLPRIRDAIDIALTNARNGMKGWEEFWVQVPINTYWRQSNPLLLSSKSFLTKQHSLLKLKWMLREAEDEESAVQFAQFMKDMSGFGLGSDRDGMKAIATCIVTGEVPSAASEEFSAVVDVYESLSESNKEFAKEAADDLLQCLGTIPDGSLKDDWKYLCEMIPSTLAFVSPSDVLQGFRQVMATILRQDNVRGYMVGSEKSQAALLPLQGQLVGRFSREPSVKQVYSSNPVVHERLRRRMTGTEQPLFVGLINESTRNGLINYSAPAVNYFNADQEGLLDLLSVRLYSGGGPHSLFMKTWAAGLAYSNGIRSSETTGEIGYYAERCPSLVQTVQFVVDELRNAGYDKSLSEYAIALTFGAGRAADRYEVRGRRMAADLADGITPEAVSSFRQGILDLRQDAGLYDKLASRLEAVTGRILPGWGPKLSEVQDASCLLIGPESQFEAFEEYLKAVEGEDVVLYRIYPRDFWLVN
ncbi:MAG: hypothetical protein AB1483_11410 [Candidatus Zixiibacteriota bacterium]